MKDPRGGKVASMHFKLFFVVRLFIFLGVVVLIFGIRLSSFFDVKQYLKC